MADAVEEVIDTTKVDGKINVDPDDPRLTGIEAEKQETIDGYNKTIDGVASGVDTMVTEQQAAIDESAQELIDAQNHYTDETVKIIEGQQEEARKDYEDEARGAYVDWKRQSNPFGANAEQMMANGLSGSGYSETSKVRMYQSYQNRKAMAFEAFSKAKTEYNNQITMAREQNSLTIAQIATDALKEKAKIALEGFYYKNDLIIGKANKELEIGQYYDGKWLDERDRIYDEERDLRDFLQRQAEQAQAQANWQAEFDARYGNDVIVKDDDNGVDLPSINFNPSLTTGNKSLDRMTNVAGKMDEYPDFPPDINGNPVHLTMEQVGIENIHSVDDSNIKEVFGDISAEVLAKLVEMGAVKEVLYKDKDGKIGLKFEIVENVLKEADWWQSKGSGRAATGLGAVTQTIKDGGSGTVGKTKKEEEETPKGVGSGKTTTGSGKAATGLGAVTRVNK